MVFQPCLNHEIRERILHMRPRQKLTFLICLLTTLSANVCSAQTLQAQREGEPTRMRRGFGGGREARQSTRADYPTWESKQGFSRDLFTFVRVQFDSSGGRGSDFGGWRNDYPDCDWNFSFRLQQLTSLRVAPEAKTLRLTEPELFDYPFLFMTNMGAISIDAQERWALRKYLLQGGFLMADDFWAAAEWNHIRQTMRQVLPDREPRELTLDHDIFHIVYDLKKLPQVPSIRAWQRGLTYEDWHGPFTGGDTSPHFWGFFDDNQRLVALFCHNNDVADGWEREGEEIEYFKKYSLPVSYPFGINIITYAMTH
jgi:Domain of unknown function (DUF4159)